MSAVVWWTGAATWALILACLLWLAGEALAAVVVTASQMRWRMRLALRRGVFWQLKWRYFPADFAREWWFMLGRRNDGSLVTTCQTTGAQWRWFNDWTLPQPPAPEGE